MWEENRAVMIVKGDLTRPWAPAGLIKENTPPLPHLENFAKAAKNSLIILKSSKPRPPPPPPRQRSPNSLSLGEFHVCVALVFILQECAARAHFIQRLKSARGGGVAWGLERPSETGRGVREWRGEV